MYELRLKGLIETENFGKKLGSLIEAEDILCLTGDLGAGKTTLTKSIGLGLGVEDYITSPTFSLVNEYKGRDFMVYHFDVYRLENIDSIDELGFDEYFYSKAASIIEWGEKIEEFLPKDRINIEIKKGQDLDERYVKIFGTGKKVERLIEELDRI